MTPDLIGLVVGVAVFATLVTLGLRLMRPRPETRHRSPEWFERAFDGKVSIDPSRRQIVVDYNLKGK